MVMVVVPGYGDNLAQHLHRTTCQTWTVVDNIGVHDDLGPGRGYSRDEDENTTMDGFNYGASLFYGLSQDSSFSTLHGLLDLASVSLLVHEDLQQHWTRCIHTTDTAGTAP